MLSLQGHQGHSRHDSGMDSKELRSRVLTFPSRLLSRPSGEKVYCAPTEPSQLSATAALDVGKGKGIHGFV